MSTFHSMMRQNGHLPMKQLGADRIMFVHRAPGQGFTTVSETSSPSLEQKLSTLAKKQNLSQD